MPRGEGIPDRSPAAVDAADHDNEREGDADDQNRALDEVGVENRLQTTGVGVDDGDDTHDNDQHVDIEPCDLGECHGREVHDDGHTAELVDDEHECAEDAEFAALEALFEVVVRRVDLELAVDRQEVADGERDREQHTELCPPKDPRAVIRVARDREERDRAEQCGKDGDAGDVPRYCTVALKELLALHFFFRVVETCEQNAHQVDDKDCRVNPGESLMHSYLLLR